MMSCWRNDILVISLAATALACRPASERPDMDLTPIEAEQPAFLIDTFGNPGALVHVLDLGRGTYAGKREVPFTSFEGVAPAPGGEALYLLARERLPASPKNWLRELLYQLGLMPEPPSSEIFVLSRFDLTNGTRTEIDRIEGFYLLNHLTPTPQGDAFFLTGSRAPQSITEDQPVLILHLDPDAHEIRREIPLVAQGNPYQKQVRPDSSFSITNLTPYSLSVSPDGRHLALIAAYDHMEAEVIERHGRTALMRAETQQSMDRLLVLVDLEREQVVFGANVGSGHSHLFSPDGQGLFVQHRTLGVPATLPPHRDAVHLSRLDLQTLTMDTVYTSPYPLILLPAPGDRILAYPRTASPHTDVVVLDAEGRKTDEARLPFRGGLAAFPDDTTLCFVEVPEEYRYIPLFPSHPGSKKWPSGDAKRVTFHFVDTNSWQTKRSAAVEMPEEVDAGKFLFRHN